MPKSKPPYPDEFRARVVELARAGRTLRSLSREFSVTETTIRSWVRQADLDQGRRSDGLTSEEKQELARLRKENARLREERDILEKAAAWFAQESVGSRKKRSDS
jgi:transposase-like protein